MDKNGKKAVLDDLVGIARMLEGCEDKTPQKEAVVRAVKMLQNHVLIRKKDLACAVSLFIGFLTGLVLRNLL